MPHFNKENYQEFTPIAEGDYPFTVTDAQTAFSQKGNEMINLTLSVEAGERTVKIFDRLVFTDKALGFIKAFCEATGLTENWESGMLDPEDCVGVEGMVHLEMGEKRDDGKQYMEVGFYIPKNAKPKFSEQPKKQAPKQAAVTAPVVDDDFKF